MSPQHVFDVAVSADIPYPWEKHYRITARSFAAAIHKALVFYSGDLKERNGGRARRLDNYEVSITKRASGPCQLLDTYQKENQDGSAQKENL